MAILLTVVVVEALTSGKELSWLILPVFAWKFTVGPLVGYLLARLALAMFNRLNPQERGYYYVLLLAVVLLTYGLAEAAKASGMLAVFTAGLVMGNRKFIYRQGVQNFSAALSVIANIGVFVMMGLLVFPSQWSAVWLDGVLLFAVLAFVARPVAVWLGTLGMGFQAKERMFMSWAGLRGAVPIVLATYPMAAGLSAGADVFNLVFVAVILSVGIQGSTLGWLARVAKLSSPSRPLPRYGLELVTMAQSSLELFVVDLPDPKGCPGPRIRELALPPGAILTLVTRGDAVLSPTGHTRLLGWDQVTILAHAKDETEVRTALLEPFHKRDVSSSPCAEPVAPDTDRVVPAQISAERRGHVVLLGHGDVGSVLARFLQQRGMPFVVIEHDALTAAGLREQGLTVLRGEGEDPALLERAGIREASIFLVTATQPVAARRAVEHAQRLNPQLEVIVRVHHEALSSALAPLERVRLVQGDVELAYAMARFLLLATGTSAIETEALIYDARRGQPGTTPTRFVEIPVPPASPVVGKRLADVVLPRDSLVVKILREGEALVPSGQTKICAEDVLFVLTDVSKVGAIEQVVDPLCSAGLPAQEDQ